jgi:hypothetical protein
MTRFINTTTGLAIVAGLYSVAPPAAHAEALCTTNDGTRIIVAHDPGRWKVDYTLPNGTRVNREDQYDIHDYSAGDTFTWGGRLKRNPTMEMIGRTDNRNGVFSYSERLTDTAHGTMAAFTYATCTQPSAPQPTYAPSPSTAPAPAYVPAAPAPTYPTPTTYQVSVPLNSDSGPTMQAVNVTVGGVDVSMFIDSGCSSFAITKAFADSLIANGEAAVTDVKNFQLPGNMKVPARILTIHKIQLGSRTFTDVVANDGGSEGMMLLGQSVLGQFGKFSIDRSRRELVLGG